MDDARRLGQVDSDDPSELVVPLDHANRQHTLHSMLSRITRIGNSSRNLKQHQLSVGSVTTDNHQAHNNQMSHDPFAPKSWTGPQHQAKDELESLAKRKPLRQALQKKQIILADDSSEQARAGSDIRKEFKRNQDKRVFCYYKARCEGKQTDDQHLKRDDYSHCSGAIGRSHYARGEKILEASQLTLSDGRRRPTNHLLALVYHGDWSALGEASEMKSPEQKTRRACEMSKFSESDDSSGDNDEDYCTSTCSSLESETRKDDEAKNEVSSDDEDDDRSVVSGIVSDDDESTVVRIKSSCLTSVQIRRWNGYREQVIALVQQTMPSKMNQISELMQQFDGREAELVQTLQTVCNRPRHSPSKRANQENIIHRSRGAIRQSPQSPRRSAFRLRNIHAIASIAAASTIDDYTQAVKPEYVMDDEVHPKHNPFYDSDLDGTNKNVDNRSDEEDSGSESDYVESSEDGNDDDSYGKEDRNNSISEESNEGADWCYGGNDGRRREREISNYGSHFDE